MVTHSGPDDASRAPRKVALVANCLLNQNAKVCEGARYRGGASRCRRGTSSDRTPALHPSASA